MKTLVIAVLIAATAAVAIAPIATLNAMAAPNGDQQNFCIHNGNGRQQEECSGNSGNDVTCTKDKGKYVCVTD